MVKVRIDYIIEVLQTPVDQTLCVSVCMCVCSIFTLNNF